MFLVLAQSLNHIIGSYFYFFNLLLVSPSERVGCMSTLEPLVSLFIHKHLQASNGVLGEVSNNQSMDFISKHLPWSPVEACVSYRLVVDSSYFNPNKLFQDFWSHLNVKLITPQILQVRTTANFLALGCLRIQHEYEGMLKFDMGCSNYVMNRGVVEAMSNV